jgi:hypothetical protein
MRSKLRRRRSEKKHVNWSRVLLRRRKRRMNLNLSQWKRIRIL